MGFFGPSREEKEAQRKNSIATYMSTVARVKVLGTTGISTTYGMSEGKSTTNIWITLLVEKTDGSREIISNIEDDDFIKALVYRVDMNR